jgi:uncharacterized protein YbaR (Trm112 family)
MKQFLLPHLICPACLPAELPLDVTTKRTEYDDIVSGELVCRKCRKRFPIKEGIAYLLPNSEGYSVSGQRRYDENEMVNRYLWSHYADLAGDPEGASTGQTWAALLDEIAVSAFDAGCAVGRLTFEMATRSKWAVGCDLSVNFIRAARRLVHDRCCTFSLPLEGNLRETFQCELPAEWRFDNLDFVVADAMAVPFAKNTFQQISSLNLLDRVSYPLAHLYEMNRVAHPRGASFLFADPFSWSTSSTPEERWLGGTVQGEYAGRGVDNVRRLLTAEKTILSPAWQIEREGSVTWQMRTHTNHRELIRSEYLLAVR